VGRSSTRKPPVSGGNVAQPRGPKYRGQKALERSLAILRNAYGPDALCVATVLNAPATVNAQSGDTATAMQQRAEAAQIQAKQTPSGATEPGMRMGRDISAPIIVSKIDPAYSEEARKIHYSGTVLLSVVVTPEGAPADVHVLCRSAQVLTKKQWML